MKDVIIRVENVSKHYRLGVLNSGSLKQDLYAWWEKNFSPKTPAPKNIIPIAEANSNEIWALKNISFEVEKGEVLGFVGKNGAGKSTLLKILSRITLPTTGTIRGRGRIASLLEVGTGFHNELTGRENIYLNGQILGMKKSEVAAKFDDIVDFSGVEQFLDTPVKRYSSGMYVRLAFAVAAHLDPEILIVDEVLAVGDAEFQRKCLGKMKDAASQKGKTILFVSHNMQALRNLCQRAIFLERGQIMDMGEPDSVIANYLNREKSNSLAQSYETPEAAPGNEYIKIKKVELIPQYVNNHNVIDIRTPLLVEFEFWYQCPEECELIVVVHLFTLAGECVFDVCSKGYSFDKGPIKGSCLIPGHFLNDGSYYLSLIFVKDTTNPLFYFEACLSFDIEDHREDSYWFGKWMGAVRPHFPVRLQQDTITAP